MELSNLTPIRKLQIQLLFFRKRDFPHFPSSYVTKSDNELFSEKNCNRCHNSYVHNHALTPVHSANGEVFGSFERKHFSGFLYLLQLTSGSYPGLFLSPPKHRYFRMVINTANNSEIPLFCLQLSSSFDPELFFFKYQNSGHVLNPSGERIKALVPKNTTQSSSNVKCNFFLRHLGYCTLFPNLSTY